MSACPPVAAKMRMKCPSSHMNRFAVRTRLCGLCCDIVVLVVLTLFFLPWLWHDFAVPRPLPRRSRLLGIPCDRRKVGKVSWQWAPLEPYQHMGMEGAAHLSLPSDDGVTTKRHKAGARVRAWHDGVAGLRSVPPVDHPVRAKVSRQPARHDAGKRHVAQRKRRSHSYDVQSGPRVSACHA